VGFAARPCTGGTLRELELERDRERDRDLVVADTEADEVKTTRRSREATSAEFFDRGLPKGRSIRMPHGRASKKRAVLEA
jgi:hypothetical protein